MNFGLVWQQGFLSHDEPSLELARESRTMSCENSSVVPHCLHWSEEEVAQWIELIGFSSYKVGALGELIINSYRVGVAIIMRLLPIFAYCAKTTNRMELKLCEQNYPVGTIFYHYLCYLILRNTGVYYEQVRDSCVRGYSHHRNSCLVFFHFMCL